MSLTFLQIPTPLPAAKLRCPLPTGAGGANWIVTLLLLLWLPLGQLRAQGVPPRPTPPRLVNDLAGLLKPEEADALEQKLVAYDDSTSSQIAVVTVPTLGDQEVAAYAEQLFESWGIGRKGKDNGLLVLVSLQPRKAWIQTGRGLEGAVPDALAKRIVSNTLAPAFQQGKYYAGLDRATDQLIALAKGEYKADPADARPVDDGRGGGGSSGPSFWVIILILVLVFWFLSRRGGGGGRNNRGGFGGGFMPPIIFGDFSGGRGVFGGGGGGFGGGGGGGFGGFGGGSSGGGGAGGDW